MIIDCISDLHGHFPKLEGGDLLIVAGDLTWGEEPEEYLQFAYWLFKQQYRRYIVVAGNHDNLIEKQRILGEKAGLMNYLEDSGTEFEGLKIWGSPWTKSFEGMNPKCKAFTLDTEQELSQKWEMIPDDIDILITHSPPFEILDRVQNYTSGKTENCGSKKLMIRLHEIQPKLHVFGHIHEAYGLDEDEWNLGPKRTKYVNASHVNEHYKPVNKPIRVIL